VLFPFRDGLLYVEALCCLVTTQINSHSNPIPKHKPFYQRAYIIYPQPQTHAGNHNLHHTSHRQPQPQTQPQRQPQPQPINTHGHRTPKPMAKTSRKNHGHRNLALKLQEPTGTHAHAVAVAIDEEAQQPNRREQIF
jgi:hypothetical protein